MRRCKENSEGDPEADGGHLGKDELKGDPSSRLRFGLHQRCACSPLGGRKAPWVAHGCWARRKQQSWVEVKAGARVHGGLRVSGACSPAA